MVAIQSIHAFNMLFVIIRLIIYSISLRALNILRNTFLNMNIINVNIYQHFQSVANL